MTRDTSLALTFGSAVSEYELGRPGYPAEAVDWIVSRLAPPTGSGAPRTFVDVGAGTGKFTAALLGRDANVIAVEPDPAMRSTLSSKFPDLEAVAGRGEMLPLADGQADLVSFAQAWHWVDVPTASAEIARVLKPGGTLALVWNIRDESVDWVARLAGIMGRSVAEDFDSIDPPVAAPLQRYDYAEFAWDNPLNREQLVAMITSRSYIIAMAPDARAELVRRVDALLDEHPDLVGLSTYTVPYVTRVTLVSPASAD